MSISSFAVDMKLICKKAYREANRITRTSIKLIEQVKARPNMGLSLRISFQFPRLDRCKRVDRYEIFAYKCPYFNKRNLSTRSHLSKGIESIITTKITRVNQAPDPAGSTNLVYLCQFLKMALKIFSVFQYLLKSTRSFLS